MERAMEQCDDLTHEQAMLVPQPLHRQTDTHVRETLIFHPRYEYQRSLYNEGGSRQLQAS